MLFVSGMEKFNGSLDAAMAIYVVSGLIATHLPTMRCTRTLKGFRYLYMAIGAFGLLVDAQVFVFKSATIGYAHRLWQIMFDATFFMLIACMLGTSETELHHAAEIQRLQALLQLKDVEMARLQSERAAEQAEATKQLAAKAAVSAELARLRMEDYRVHQAQLLQMQHTIHNCEETIAWLSKTDGLSAKTPPWQA
jgi:hypothetical protein